MVAEARLIDICEPGPEELCPHRTGGERAAWIAGWWRGYRPHPRPADAVHPLSIEWRGGQPGNGPARGEVGYGARRQELELAWRDGWECGRAVRGGAL